MIRLFFFLVLLGCISAALTGCHADVGGGIGRSMVIPAR
jgi:hypothetical protein